MALMQQKMSLQKMDGSCTGDQADPAFWSCRPSRDELRKSLSPVLLRDTCRMAMQTDRLFAQTMAVW